ncbi:MAG: queuosine precursor transporter [Oscillospiraceae bacterium]|nr:queuosine precursor transporter [Oscillospiraceae bacterium]
MNELLLIGSVILTYGAVVVAYRLFGKVGMYAMTAISTILANIEVLMLVDGFGMEQTLGNVMFASTYLITDILSENESKESASRAVWLGVFTAAAMFIFTQYWQLYTPAESDWATPHIEAIFSTTPRLLLGSFLGYAVSQRIDVWLYHRIWNATTKKSGDSKRFLWLRNNGSTMLSQIINTVLFTLIAFAGVYDNSTLISIMISSYVVYIFTSLADTPAVYLARIMKQKNKIPE